MKKYNVYSAIVLTSLIASTTLPVLAEEAQKNNESSGGFFSGFGPVLIFAGILAVVGFRLKQWLFWTSLSVMGICYAFAKIFPSETGEGFFEVLGTFSFLGLLYYLALWLWLKQVPGPFSGDLMEVVRTIQNLKDRLVQRKDGFDSRSDNQIDRHNSGNQKISPEQYERLGKQLVRKDSSLRNLQGKLKRLERQKSSKESYISNALSAVDADNASDWNELRDIEREINETNREISSCERDINDLNKKINRAAKDLTQD